MAAPKKKARKAPPPPDGIPSSSSSAKAPKKKKATKAAKAPKLKAAKKERIRVPDEDDFLKGVLSMKGVEEDDYAYLADPLSAAATVDSWLSTGVLAIDRLTGGGWPIGRITEVAAWESVGKSTLVDQSIAQAQRDGAICMLIDTERARDEKYSQSLGVNTKKLIVHNAATVEEVFAGIDRMLALQTAYIEKLKKKKLQVRPLLIVWDSVAGTPTAAELGGAADDNHVASAAKVIKKNMRRLTQTLNHANAALVMTNQFYSGIGPFSSLKTYGGSGIKYFTSIRIWLTNKGQLKIGPTVVGHKLEVKLKKTRITKPRPNAETGLIHGAGIHNAYSLFQWGKLHGVPEVKGHRWIAQRGAWSYLLLPNGEQIAFAQSYLGLGKELAERPDVYAAMVAQYLKEEPV